MAGKKLEIPYFVEMRGCVNCPASALMRQKTGKDYGFDHEIAAYCVLKECLKYGYGIYSPFLDPEEVINFAKRSGDSVQRERAGEYCDAVKRRFGAAFEAMGVSLDALVAGLNQG